MKRLVMVLAAATLAATACSQGKPEPAGQPTAAPTPTGAEGTAVGLGPSENCGVIATEENRGQQHLAENELLPPDTPQPASSGPHSPFPLPADPHVYFQPIEEARAIHNLEHGYVLIYYAPDILDSTVLEQLSALAENEFKVIMAPYDLGPLTALSFVAWTKQQTCGPAVTPEEATEQATTFIRMFAGSEENAPEPFGP